MQLCSVSVYNAIFGDIDPGYVVRLPPTARVGVLPSRRSVSLTHRVCVPAVDKFSTARAQLNAIMMTVNTMWLVLTAVLCTSSATTRVTVCRVP